ncbi:MAG: CBS domain-containing protein [Clostridiales bacterium]|jgi:CBS domain-containing protein|nr:CBS domain-containing protein [Clostridia bacterium]MCR5683606.1 CBS domain-containing protein [Clostridiales bacterium]
MNVLMLLTPKSEVRYLKDSATVRAALETMKHHGYTALPVVTKEGAYAGSVSEGDFLRYIVEHDVPEEWEKVRLREILRPDFHPAVTASVTTEELIRRAENQNFIPVTDDRGTFIGIVTRKTVIETFCEPQIDRESRMRA